MVLCHGVTDNGLCWTHLAQGLEKDYDLIMYDVRGHGLSDKPETGYTLTELSREMAGLPLLEALDPGFIARTPLYLVDSFGPPPAPGGVAAPRSSMDEEMVARLRSLGYLGD